MFSTPGTSVNKLYFWKVTIYVERLYLTDKVFTSFFFNFSGKLRNTWKLHSEATSLSHQCLIRLLKTYKLKQLWYQTWEIISILKWNEMVQTMTNMLVLKNWWRLWDISKGFNTNFHRFHSLSMNESEWNEWKRINHKQNTRWQHLSRL